MTPSIVFISSLLRYVGRLSYLLIFFFFIFFDYLIRCLLYIYRNRDIPTCQVQYDSLLLYFTIFSINHARVYNEVFVDINFFFLFL